MLNTNDEDIRGNKDTGKRLAQRSSDLGANRGDVIAQLCRNQIAESGSQNPGAEAFTSLTERSGGTDFWTAILNLPEGSIRCVIRYQAPTNLENSAVARTGKVGFHSMKEAGKSRWLHSSHIRKVLSELHLTWYENGESSRPGLWFIFKALKSFLLGSMTHAGSLSTEEDKRQTNTSILKKKLRRDCFQLSLQNPDDATTRNRPSTDKKKEQNSNVLWSNEKEIKQNH